MKQARLDEFLNQHNGSKTSITTSQSKTGSVNRREQHVSIFQASLACPLGEGHCLKLRIRHVKTHPPKALIQAKKHAARI